MSMRIYKVMPKKTKIKLTVIGVTVCTLVLISIPYFVNVLNNHTSDPVAEIEIPKTESPEVEPTPAQAPEPVPEPVPTPEPEPIEPAPVANETSQVYYTYTTTVAQPTVATQPDATPVVSEPVDRGTRTDDNGADDPGYTSTGIDDPCAKSSICEQ